MLLWAFMKTKDPIQPSEKERSYYDSLEDHFAESDGSSLEKLRNFAKYVPRQDLSLFIAKYEMFRRVLSIHGSIVEGGVHLGGGLMTFAQLSTVLEPVNYQRKIIGFDTFEGFPGLAQEDAGSKSEMAKKRGFAISSKKLQDLQASISLYDQNRFLGHIPKVELVKGDVMKTLPRYLKENQELVVSLLYLDYDIFEPTKRTIELLVPRMPKGAIIAFDELNAGGWPGETLAVLKTIGLNGMRLRRFPFVPALSFAVIGD